MTPQFHQKLFDYYRKETEVCAPKNIGASIVEQLIQQKEGISPKLLLGLSSAAVGLAAVISFVVTWDLISNRKENAPPPFVFSEPAESSLFKSP